MGVPGAHHEKGPLLKDPLIQVLGLVGHFSGWWFGVGFGDLNSWFL